MNPTDRVVRYWGVPSRRLRPDEDHL